jgi:hypothetical protein
VYRDAQLCSAVSCACYRNELTAMSADRMTAIWRRTTLHQRPQGTERLYPSFRCAPARETVRHLSFILTAQRAGEGFGDMVLLL